MRIRYRHHLYLLLQIRSVNRLLSVHIIILIIRKYLRHPLLEEFLTLVRHIISLLFFLFLLLLLSLFVTFAAIPSLTSLDLFTSSFLSVCLSFCQSVYLTNLPFCLFLKFLLVYLTVCVFLFINTVLAIHQSVSESLSQSVGRSFSL